MANQSLASVPPNVDQPLVLRRFLLRLVEQLDVLLGNRGNAASTSYVSQAELSAATGGTANSVVDLAEQISELSTSLTTLSATLTELIDSTDLILDRSLELAWTKGFSVSFIGRSTNGSLTMTNSYNIATGERVAAGVYEFTLTQTTILSTTILDVVQPAVDHLFSVTATSELFKTEYTTAGLAAGTFRVLVYEVTAVATKPTLTAYDPITAGDVVRCSGLANLPGALP